MSDYSRMIRFGKTTEFYPALLVGFAWSARPLLYYLGIFADKIGIGSSLLITLLFVFLSIKSMDYLRKTVKITDFLALLLFLGVFFSTYFLHPENIEYLNKYKDFFLLAIPYYIVGRVYSDYEMRACLRIFSYISIAVMSFYFLFFGRVTGSIDSILDSLNSSYMLLPHVLMALLVTLYNRSFVNIFFSLLGVFLMLGFGSRGPVLCVIVFVATILIIIAPFKHKILGRIITIGVILVIYFSIDKILSSLGEGLSSVGMSTRIMDYYSDGMLNDSSGRDEIQTVILRALSDNLLLGLGICGDMRIAAGYSHNVVIEILASFGVLIGGFILISLFTCYYKAYRNCLNNEQKGIWLVLFISGFVGLLFSGTYLTSSFFYFLLGYSVTLNKQKTKFSR